MKKLHSWNLSYQRATDLQERLACKVRHTPLKRTPETVAGIDCAFSRNGEKILAAVVVLKFDGMEVVETADAVRKVTFPYIPGLLSFVRRPFALPRWRIWRSSRMYS